MTKNVHLYHICWIQSNMVNRTHPISNLTIFWEAFLLWLIYLVNIINLTLIINLQTKPEQVLIDLTFYMILLSNISFELIRFPNTNVNLFVQFIYTTSIICFNLSTIFEFMEILYLVQKVTFARWIVKRSIKILRYENFYRFQSILIRYCSCQRNWHCLCNII